MLSRAALAPAAGAVALLAVAGLTPPAAQAAMTAPVARASATAPAHGKGTGSGFGRAAGAQLVKDLRQAWRTTKGHGVTVAVVGGTVAPDTAGLAGRVIRGPLYGHLAPGQATDGTLFASAVAGGGHSSQNPFGTLGMAPQARILSIGVQSTVPTATWLDDVSKAIMYAVAHGAGVIYIEQVSFSDSERLAAAVAYALAKNVVVASAEYGPAKPGADPEYPASLPGVIDAASVTLPGLAAPPARYPTPANGSILVAAPGNILHEAGPGGTSHPIYNFFAADAWLTATAALIKSAHSGLSPSLVSRALAASALDRPPGGYSLATGFGLIDPSGALAEASRLSGLRAVAAPGPGLVPRSARLAAGPEPGPIQAVHHSDWKLAGYALLMLAGMIVLLRARRLRKRWRRRARLPTAQSHRVAHN
jgi:hypothetical protein